MTINNRVRHLALDLAIGAAGWITLGLAYAALPFINANARLRGARRRAR